MKPQPASPTEDSAPVEPARPADEAPRGRGSLPELLAEQCSRLGAEAGAVLAVTDRGRVDLLAVHPRPTGDTEPPAWLTEALVSARDLAGSGPIAVRALHDPQQLYGQPAQRHLVMASLATDTGPRGLLALTFETDDPQAAAARVRQMQTRVASLELLALHLGAAGPKRPLPQLARAMAVLTALNEHDRFVAAAMAFCNELASRWDCRRVSLGFVKARSIRLAAMSHTEKFSRQTQAVQRIEMAMEECLDQDVEVAFPPPSGADSVSRAARELAADATQAAVLSMPLRRAEAVAAVVTLERPADKPFTAEQIESLRLTCELCTPRLADLRKSDRWIGAKAAGGVRRGLAAVVGPRHTWLKLLLLLAIAGGIYLSAATGEYRVDAPFVLEASQVQVLPAPFDGQIEAVLVSVGDRVQPGQVLVKLKTLSLERQVNAARAELFEYRKQADSARAVKKFADAQMAEARARQLDEQIQLLSERIDKAQLKALIAGTIVGGKIEQFVGATVEKGKVLLEVAPLDSLRAELAVPEDQIADLQATLARDPVDGSLATASYPDEPIDFTVERILPMAEDVEGQAVFKVRASLRRTPDWMRPGMGGVAHVRLGRGKLGWIWTRRLVNRLRLWLWL